MNSDGYQHHARAAEGWFELGNLPEARREFERIVERHYDEPAVKRLRFHFAAHDRDLGHALELAKALVESGDAEIHIWRGYGEVLFQLNRASDAVAVAREAIKLFPADSQLCYNASRYTCQQRQWKEAAQWLWKACQYGDSVLIRSHSVKDPDLSELWSNIPNECGGNAKERPE